MKDSEYKNLKEKLTRENRVALGLCRDCGQERENKERRFCEECLRKYRTGYRKGKNKDPLKIRKKNLRRKIDVIKKYGGKCVCCGEDNVLLLTMDHKNNDGATQRNEMPYQKTSLSLYIHLSKNEIQDDMQVMCSNCNFSKYIYGICPHQMSEEMKLNTDLIIEYRNGLKESNYTWQKGRKKRRSQNYESWEEVMKYET